ncbi:hypothetical protein RFEPED_1447 [Rickettsia felis str. Pedreira]|uniref:Uncharacterized protein n=1 Tax=Rickettsia felis str. Pedreira TaxID=1359196 RepID=A0A0F3MTK4_RICFI|nr:hypothetical protein RFEPED_1447 [Rickettsia felis str. Pedreira]
MHESKNLLDVIPAKAGIHYKARLIELLILKTCCIYTFFWIPAFAGMT